MNPQSFTPCIHNLSSFIKRAIRIISVILCASLCPSVIQAIDTLHVQMSDPILEDWRWAMFSEKNGLAGPVQVARA